MSPDDARGLFRIWAPENGRWSAWAKPVLFTYAFRGDVQPSGSHATPASNVQLAAVPGAGSGAALVVDLPGASGVAFGIALAERGYRPVPLYNVTTGPGQDVIDVMPLLGALRKGAGPLATLSLPDDAPPAFLIDSRRLDGLPAPTMYDNRWMIFPQDFPSGRALAASGISRVVVIRGAEPLRSDLRAVLRLFRREGIEVEALDPVTGASAALAFDLSIWSLLSEHVSSVWNGLRENSAGGFGGTVPKPQATSGGFG